MKALVLGILFGGLACAAEPALQTDLGAGQSLDLVLVPAGEFTQGSPASEPGRGADEDQRPVRISAPFYISRTAVTRGQWERFIAETGYRSEAETGTSGGFGWDGKALVQRKEFTWRNPGFPQTADHPVCLVTFPDAEAFCRWLERKTGLKTNLPTEAQWEFACRAGTTTPWHGAGSDTAWHKGNSGDGTRPADSKPPNPWGLFISGNVSEWCLDWYAPYDANATTDPQQTNPNLSDKPRRVLRGGSWNRDAKNTRSAARFRSDPRSRNADIGFRIVSVVDATVPPVTTLPADAPPTIEVEHSPPQASAPPAGPASGISWWSALPCLLVPIGLIIMLVRFVARGQSRSSPFTVPIHPPPPPPDVSQAIRKVAGGFWVRTTHPPGTPIHLKYTVAGRVIEQTLAYQPGPEGQFVYTGTEPDHISVVGAGLLPPPLSQRPPALPDRGRTASPRHDRTTMFPPAY
jgi:formylglycine-generating enzyme required for sulfatase activity